MEMVSVIIPTYNRGNVIARSINSVLNQNYQNFEILVVDDNSTDDTEQIVSQIKDSRIHYIKCDKHVGANGARNKGIQNARGKYIAFQDSDDVWIKEKLEKQIKVFNTNKEAKAVFCRYKKNHMNGEQTIVPERNMNPEGLKKELERVLATGNVIGTPTMVIKRECFEECGKFDEELLRFQDWELAIRLVEKFDVVFFDEVLVDVFEMNTCISRDEANKAISMARILKKHQKFFEKYNLLNWHLGNIIESALDEKKLNEILDVLGEKMFMQGLYEKHERHITLKKNSLFLRKWIEKESREAVLNNFINKYERASVVLYGLGYLGKMVLNILSDENKDRIKYIIDKNAMLSSEYGIKTLQNLKGNDFDEVECIIITAIAHEEEIKKELKSITNVNAIGLTDIVF